MIKNPHLICANVLDTLQVSGLTYSLNETPFSCNIVLRKKYVKNFEPKPDFNVMNYEVNCTDFDASLCSFTFLVKTVRQALRSYGGKFERVSRQKVAAELYF